MLSIPFILSISYFQSMSHKQERFLYFLYPMMCLWSSIFLVWLFQKKWKVRLYSWISFEKSSFFNYFWWSNNLFKYFNKTKKIIGLVLAVHFIIMGLSLTTLDFKIRSDYHDMITEAKIQGTNSKKYLSCIIKLFTNEWIHNWSGGMAKYFSCEITCFYIHQLYSCN